MRDGNGVIAWTSEPTFAVYWISARAKAPALERVYGAQGGDILAVQPWP
jgi:hypothetical protein